eukprot:6851778-Prymnesium_polylepis.2
MPSRFLILLSAALMCNTGTDTPFVALGTLPHDGRHESGLVCRARDRSTQARQVYPRSVLQRDRGGACGAAAAPPRRYGTPAPAADGKGALRGAVVRLVRKATVVAPLRTTPRLLAGAAARLHGRLHRPLQLLRLQHDPLRRQRHRPSLALCAAGRPVPEHCVGPLCEHAPLATSEQYRRYLNHDRHRRAALGAAVAPAAVPNGLPWFGPPWRHVRAQQRVLVTASPSHSREW